MGGKKRQRGRYENPQPFLAADNNSVASKKRTKSKQHQQEDNLVPAGLSSKTLREAMVQEREIEDEEARAQNPNSSLLNVSEAPHKDQADEEESIDDIGGFSQTQNHFGGYDWSDEHIDKLSSEIDEDDEKLLEAFLSKDAGPQLTQADLLIAGIKEKHLTVASDARPSHELDASTIELYKGVGVFLSKYTSGKVPKSFKYIPLVRPWEDVLYLTKPENWSPNAMYEATRIFASNMSKQKVPRFYQLFLLPRVREDIRKNKRLHFSLYRSLKKSLYKPDAFFVGILLPLCKSGTCNLREAVIFGSIILKVSIPPLCSSSALVELARMKYRGTTSYFMKILLDKKYALQYHAIDAIVAHFMRFLEETRILPVIWHQSLLSFVQRYKNQLQKEDKDNLRNLLEKQKHNLVTPEIRRELDNSLNRGEKEEDLMIASPAGVINKPFEEDFDDIPEVPMEDD